MTMPDCFPNVETPLASPTEINECARAREILEQVVRDGLRHGFFECAIVCEIVNGKKRRLVIKAGLTHQFIISLEQLDRSS